MPIKLRLYRLSYEFHRFWMAIWKPFLLAADIPIVLALIAWLLLNPKPNWVAVVGRVGLGLLGIWGIFLLAWLVFSGWHGIATRGIAWGLARLLGGVRQALLSGWGGLLLVFLGVVVFIGLRSALLGQVENPVEILSSDQLLQILAALTLILLFYLIAQSRRRIVIEKFGNYLGDATLDQSIEGLSNYLMDKLSHLAALYRNIDEAFPQRISGAVEATVTALDADTELKGLAAAGSQVKVGPLVIPIDSLFSLIGRLVQGPRLTGSVHKEGSTLVLLASLSGSRGGSWRVLATDLDSPVEGDTGEILHAMMEQMAYRIFTDLVSMGTKQWRAAYHYSEGLRQYRKTLRVESDRMLRLRQAEQCFIKALAEDKQFAQCHYNLGVVYRKLEQPVSAVAAFRQTLSQEPAHYDASYALALNLYLSSAKAGRFTEVIQLCDYAIHVRPEEPRAWNLKGLALRKEAEERLDVNPLAFDDPTWQKIIIPVRATAVVLAWRQMCRWTLSGRPTEGLRDTVNESLRNLAVAHTQTHQYSVSQRIFAQALRFNPDDADLRLEFSRILVDRRQWKDVLRILTRVYDYSLSSATQRAIYWANLAAAHAALYTQNPARQGWRVRVVQDASDRFLDLSVSVAGDRARLKRLLTFVNHPETDYLRTALEQVGLKETAQRLKRLGGFYRWLGNAARGSNLPKGIADWGWAEAQLQLILADQSLQKKKYPLAQERYRQAISALESRHLHQVTEQGLYGRLAYAYQVDNHLSQALDCALQAVELAPESAWERRVLGNVYYTLKDYPRAVNEWLIGLKINPGDTPILQNLVVLHWARGAASTDPQARRQSFAQVILLLNNALQIWKLRLPANVPGDKIRLQSQVFEYAWVHYWLGRFHKELLSFDDAIHSLKISIETGYKPLESRVALADTYLDAKAYSEARSAFRDVLHQAQSINQEKCKKNAAWRKKSLPARWDPDSGEERPLFEWAVCALLGLAQTCAEQNVRLAWARRNLTIARRWLPQIQDRSVRIHNQVDYHDIMAWILLREGNLHGALKELNQAVALESDALAHCLFVQVYQELAKKDTALAAQWQEKARQAALALRQCDLRGKYKAEADAVLGETPAVLGVTPAAQTAQATVQAAAQVAAAPAANAAPLEPEVNKKH